MGEFCKLPQWSLGQSPTTYKMISCHADVPIWLLKPNFISFIRDCLNALQLVWHIANPSRNPSRNLARAAFGQIFVQGLDSTPVELEPKSSTRLMSYLIMFTSCKYPSSRRSCLGPAVLCPPYLSWFALASVRRNYRSSRSNSLGSCGPL